MAKLFPVGSISNSSNNGTIDSVSYSFVEPNGACDSAPLSHVLTSMYEQQIILTRKKAQTTLTIAYEYSNIFDKEYRQIEHFNNDVDDALESFLVVDFSKGVKPSSVSDGGGSWVISMSNTRLYSAIANQKSPYVFLKYGDGWRLGSVTSISANTSVTIDVGGSDYGALSLANANAHGHAYPVYTCYFQPNTLTNLKTTVYVDDTLTLTGCGGWMRSGAITFLSKYKV